MKSIKILETTECPTFYPHSFEEVAGQTKKQVAQRAAQDQRNSDLRSSDYCSVGSVIWDYPTGCWTYFRTSRVKLSE
jgi:hypothetical protein